MGMLPYLKQENGRMDLMVDGEPFVIWGGEFHNSSGSDLSYLETNVWPGLEKLGGNCYLTPVYWEALEPERGVYDFTLTDGVIRQAREHDVRLVLLWFGLWKNGQSQYIPAWMKRDPAYFYLRDIKGDLRECVSPFCSEAVELDKKAFVHLMEHLKETDEQHTVIMIQVENETGSWGSVRDCSEAAEEAWKMPVPENIAALYDKNGSWEDVFGTSAGENFMAWALGSAVQRIAAAGKEVYPLPMFMNCVPADGGIPEDMLPSGGPITRLHKIWRAAAPAIDLYGPDIYTPEFKKIADDYAAANPLVIPELAQNKDSASKALFSAAAYNLLCFSPFGIEGMIIPLSEQDLLSQLNTDLIAPPPYAGEILSEAYGILKVLQPEIRKAQMEGRIMAFLEQGEDQKAAGCVFETDRYTFSVTYGDGGVTNHMGESGHRRENGPIGGGFLLRYGDDRFLFCGIACNLGIRAKNPARTAFTVSKKEFYVKDGALTEGRNLNGDERNFLVIGSKPMVLEINLYTRTK